MLPLKRKVSLRLKFCTIMFTVTALLCAVTIAAAYLIHSYSTETRYKNLSQTVAQTVSGFVKSQNIGMYLNGENTLDYIEINNKIRNLKKAVPNIQCIGVYKMMPDGIQTVFDTDSADVKGGLGDVVSYDRSWSKYKEKLLDRQVVEKAEILINQGMAIMYCTPMNKDTDDYPVYVCVGVAKNVIDGEKKSFVTYNGTAIICVTVFLLLLAVFMFEKRIIKPVRRICATVEGAADKYENDFIYTIIETDLHTGNELENIYRSLLKIYTSKARLFSAMAKADENSIQAIKSLIKRMDNFTAVHLDNSIQYVILLINELRKQDKYKNLISEKDIEDLMLAAPLHDVGKLVIPEKIVGKPGKLTPAEYEIMKRHSALGGKIIEELYLKNSNEDYLHLAKEIAIHHHERWDGNGYPAGLKGEEIPLLVRIVSIADVFDALVSERVYKKAYPFDKSFNMIVEEKGKFFDPEIVDVFIGAKEKIRAVHQRISNKN